MTLYLHGSYSDTAIVVRHELRLRFGRWRLYRVSFMTKDAWLLLPYEVETRLKALRRITNTFFIGKAAS